MVHKHCPTARPIRRLAFRMPCAACGEAGHVWLPLMQEVSLSAHVHVASAAAAEAAAGGHYLQVCTRAGMQA